MKSINRSIISINFINKMIQANKMQLGNKAKNNNGRTINPAFIFSDEFTALINDNKTRHNNCPNIFNGNNNRQIANNTQHNANWGFGGNNTVTTNSNNNNNNNPGNFNNIKQSSWNNNNQNLRQQFPNGSNSNPNAYGGPFGTFSNSNTNPNSNPSYVNGFDNNTNSNNHQPQHPNQNQNQNPFSAIFSSNMNNRNVGF